MTGERWVLHVAHTLRDAGFQAFLVGGCVRDRLLGTEPKDFDVNTDASPAQVLSLFPGSQLVGAHFGVSLVKHSREVFVEVATFRSDGTYLDGRRPERVHFERDPALDAQRRDFTVNALMMDPQTLQVVDFVRGLPDLQDGLIRAIGDPRQRFQEDYLRMLRAVRFAARLDFRIEEQTFEAIRQIAPNILRISAERIRDELVRILTEGHARRGFELLDSTGLLENLLPEVKAMQGVEQPPEYHPEGDVWTHVLLMLEALPEGSETLALGALFHDVGKPPTFSVSDRIRFNNHAEVGARMSAAIMSRLKFSSEDTERVTSLVANHMRFKDVQQMRVSTLKRFLDLPHFDEHLELHRLDCAASNGYTDAYRFVQEKQAEFSHQPLMPPPLLRGNDLIAAGFKPGPAFSTALQAVETAQLEGELASREEALSLAATILHQAGNGMFEP